MRAYYPSLIMALIAFIFFYVPELAAILLGGGLISISIIYAWFTYRYQRYVKEMSSFRTTRFEEEIFKNGAPTFRTISFRIFKG